MAEMMAGFTVKPDTRFPVCPDNGPVLKAVWDNGQRFLGWWTEAAFQDWLQARGGFVVSSNDDDRIVMARLTQKERKTA